MCPLSDDISVFGVIEIVVVMLLVGTVVAEVTRGRATWAAREAATVRITDFVNGQARCRVERLEVVANWLGDVQAWLIDNESKDGKRGTERIEGELERLKAKQRELTMTPEDTEILTLLGNFERRLGSAERFVQEVNLWLEEVMGKSSESRPQIYEYLQPAKLDVLASERLPEAQLLLRQVKKSL